MSCQGPCLTHCYRKNSIILLLIGIVIGIVIGYILSSSITTTEKNTS